MENDDTETYEKEIGTRRSFPEVNARIRKQLGLANTSSSRSRLESKVDPELIMQAARIMDRTRTGEYISKKEILRIFGDLKTLGIPTARGYHGLKSERLYALFRTTRAGIMRQAKQYGFDSLNETTA